MEKWLILLAVIVLGVVVYIRQSRHKGPPTEAADTGEEPKHELIEVAPQDNPWGIPLIDLRPVTHTVVATSTDKTCAENSVSYGSETGEVFFRDLPEFPTKTACQLRYSLGGAEKLYPGVLFTPQSMDEKWAIFCDTTRIVFVRSWQRKVFAFADCTCSEGELTVSAIHGDLQTGSAGDLLVAEIDWLIRSHALGDTVPVPVEELTTGNALGLICFTHWGNKASFAGTHPLPPILAESPLASNSLLHIALAQGDRARVVELLDQGFPTDCWAADGLTTMHWASAAESYQMVELLLSKGCPIDARSREGATLLMNEAQGGDAKSMRYYLSKGADPNAKDARGFTALHRAAEFGAVELVTALLEAGGDPSVDAEGHTPISLAISQSHEEVAALLEKHRL